ncbi:MAG: hypothetical protein DRO15_01850 [Thermoprotei archaeon]|nr:MAG: hypothetical protein DRO15_01850 [Thermoprotei archaeon]
MSRDEEEFETLLEKLLEKLVESLRREREAEAIQKITLVKEVKEIIGRKSFEEFIRSNRVAIICFYSPRCPACKRYLPVFNSIAKKFSPRIAFGVLNIKDSRNREIVLDKEVFIIPTTTIYVDGKEVTKKTGYMDEEELTLFIEINTKLTQK